MSASDALADPGDAVDPYAHKWTAFSAIGISFFTMVMSMTMVFVALESIADDFDVTLRAVAWVVIAQALTISALMMPMGRLADIIGRKRVHMTGLVIFAAGAMFTALAPAFGILILARVIMAVGSSMSQSVGTAMVISVFPPKERGKAIGSQTTAVAIGGATGPVIAGLMLQFFNWEALFWMLLPPVILAFVASYFILDEKVVSPRRTSNRAPFDWIGALLSGTAIIIAVILINNPLAASWVSPIMLGSLALVIVLFSAFVMWELRSTAPMLQLRMFSNSVFSMAVLARYLGFIGTTSVGFLMPIYLISLRGLPELQAGGILVLTFVGMAIMAQTAGRLSDRFGQRPFAIAGFLMLVVTSLVFATTTDTTALWLVMITLFVNGLAVGLWNVPNNSIIMGSVPRSSFGVIGAFTNLTRNVGSVTGQAVGSAIVVGIMTTRGFDISLSEINEVSGASSAFVDGWRIAFILVTALALVGLVLSILTKPRQEDDGDE